MPSSHPAQGRIESGAEQAGAATKRPLSLKKRLPKAIKRQPAALQSLSRIAPATLVGEVAELRRELERLITLAVSRFSGGGLLTPQGATLVVRFVTVKWPHSTPELRLAVIQLAWKRGVHVDSLHGVDGALAALVFREGPYAAKRRYDIRAVLSKHKTLKSLRAALNGPGGFDELRKL